MVITTFNPQIITNDAESVVSLFEELGFEKRHNPTGIGDLNVEGIRMKDPSGFALDISQPDMRLPKDMIAIRINVDDFDEAYQLLLSRGFTNFYGDRITETDSAKSAMMVSSSGLGINLVHHIKK
ncbi:MAG: hypothetical protein J6Z43_08935 [Clostridiales bacterium]|nr:hypothetical protein [Clostridiales bacterium]